MSLIQSAPAGELLPLHGHRYSRENNRRSYRGENRQAKESKVNREVETETQKRRRGIKKGGKWLNKQIWREMGKSSIFYSTIFWSIKQSTSLYTFLFTSSINLMFLLPCYKVNIFYSKPVTSSSALCLFWLASNILVSMLPSSARHKLLLPSSEIVIVSCHALEAGE